MLNTNTIIYIVFGIAPLILSQEEKYHSNEEIESFLKNFTKTTNDDLKTRLYSIGKSKKGANLWVLEMTTAAESSAGIPNVKLIGTVHITEPVGREILFNFANYLRDNYKNDPEIAWLLNNTKIHIMPNLNPDGFTVIKGTQDCSGDNKITQDLNTNFPDFFHKNTLERIVETDAVIRWMQEYAFILSAAFYGGQVLANYPFDSSEKNTWGPGHLSLTPDDDVFKHLASVYAKNHLKMFKGNVCTNKRFIAFKGGISNGAAVFGRSFGGMADYNYFQHGCMELRIQISCCVYPEDSNLPKLWEDNRKALVKYCSEAHRGVTGRVFDMTSENKPIQNASLKVTGRNMTFFTTKNGEFWRLLLPGRYNLEILAAGYHKKNVGFEVKNQTGQFPELTKLEIGLLNLSLPSTTVSTLSTKETNTEFVTKATTEIEEEMDSDMIRDYLFDVEEVEGPKESALKASAAGEVQKSIIYFLFLVLVLL